MDHVTRSLDLGSGPHPKNPFHAAEVYGIDVEPCGANIRVADLVVEPIPFDDAMFDFVTAHDVIEHIPRLIYAPTRRYPFIQLMNEIWRVLRDGGLFFSHTPAFPRGEAFQDPTHVNIITEATFLYYFDDQHRWATKYGFTGAFRLLEQRWNDCHLLTTMRKVPVPI